MTATFMNPAASTNIANLITRQAQMRPDAVAVRMSGSNLSFEGLDTLVRHTARYLNRHDINAGDRVALSCRNELAILVIMLASARIGAAVLSLPRNMPSALRAELATRAGACRMIADHPDGDAAGLPRLCVDLVEVNSFEEPDDDCVGLESADAPWLIIAGSGSTGHPRLFAVTHRQFSARIVLARDSITLGPDDRLLSLAHLDFTSPKERCLAALSAGASVILANRDVANPVALCRQHRVTVLDATVFHLEQLLTTLPRMASNVLGSLRVLLVSASTVSDGLRLRIVRMLSPALHVRYGTNEAGLLSIASPEEGLSVPGTVGRPPAGVSIEVVDEQGNILPAGLVGQLRVRSPALVDGYLDDPEATQAAFSTAGFLPGDMGRLMPDGQLIFCGRSDHLMIMNGINIYPAEIERVIAQHPDVCDVATVPFPSALHQDIPVCAVVLERSAATTEQLLREFARQHLGAHAPHRVVILEQIPRNEQGKLMRHDLGKLLAEKLRPRIRTRINPPRDSVGASLENVRRVSRTLEIALNHPPGVALTGVDEWLKQILEGDFEPDQDAAIADAAISHGLPHALTGRCLLLMRALLQAGHIPAFSAGRILQIQTDDTDQARWKATVEIPNIDHLPESCYAIAAKAAGSALSWMARHPLNAENADALYARLVRETIKPLQRMAAGGKSTMPVLRAAWQLGIPFIHLGGGIYQLGWGCNVLRLDRSTTGQDPAIAAKLAQNKIWSAHLMRLAGLPAPVHGLVADPSDALRTARQIGWPVVVKPADGDRGEGVTVGVGDEGALFAALKLAQRPSRLRRVIVEREVPGVCHRLLIADGRLLYAVKRWPKSVIGNGQNTVSELIASANRTESLRPPWLRSEPFPSDSMAVAAISDAGFSLTSIPATGQRVPLRPIESTAWGGFDEEVTDRIHPENLEIALRAAALFGLQVAGVDIISTDIGQSWRENGAIINEVNYAPLLGGGAISRTHLPDFVARLLAGDGRIPIEAFVGGSAAMAAAGARQTALASQGNACFLTSHERTLAPNGTAVCSAVDNLFERCLALLMDPRAARLVLVIQTDELLVTGLPVDRIVHLTIVDDQLRQRGNPSQPFPKSKLTQLEDLLRSLLAGAEPT